MAADLLDLVRRQRGEQAGDSILEGARVTRQPRQREESRARRTAASLRGCRRARSLSLDPGDAGFLVAGELQRPKPARKAPLGRRARPLKVGGELPEPHPQRIPVQGVKSSRGRGPPPAPRRPRYSPASRNQNARPDEADRRCGQVARRAERGDRCPARRADRRGPRRQPPRQEGLAAPAPRPAGSRSAQPRRPHAAMAVGTSGVHGLVHARCSRRLPLRPSRAAPPHHPNPMSSGSATSSSSCDPGRAHDPRRDLLRVATARASSSRRARVDGLAHGLDERRDRRARPPAQQGPQRLRRVRSLY